MKKKILVPVMILIILMSVVLILSPLINNALYEEQKSGVLTEYTQNIKQINQTKLSALFEEANRYNKAISSSYTIAVDPFKSEGGVSPVLEAFDYSSLLKYGKSNVLTELSVPSIKLEIPVYRGTSDTVLNVGAGHLKGSSLPIGGKSTHCVISAHSGLSGKRLFTDLEKLEIGDVFYLNTLSVKLAYQVDDIKTVTPEDIDSLKIVNDEDYVTLLTCTPYGVNSHRLLVRGTRIDYEEAIIIEETTDEAIESAWMNEYIKALVLGIVIFAVILAIYLIASKKKGKGKKV